MFIYIATHHLLSGEVAEWLKALAWRASVRSRVPRVRIPPSPLRG